MFVLNVHVFKLQQVSSVNIARHLLIHQGQSLDNRDDIQQTNLVDGSHLILQGNHQLAYCTNLLHRTSLVYQLKSIQWNIYLL